MRGPPRGVIQKTTTTSTSHSIFICIRKKLILAVQLLLHTHHYVLYDTIQLWPVLFALTRSMLPIANPFPVPLTHAPRVHAAPATKHSSAATMFPYPSACSATLNSHILSFSISVSLSHSYLATSPSTNKTFYSHKNKPCYLQLKLPSPMTASSRALTNKLRTSINKSSNYSLLNKI